MLTMPDCASGTLEARASGKLTRSDYRAFMLRVRHLVQEFASIRVLLELENFAGWTAGPLWRDLDLDTSHLDSVKKLALSGTRLGKPVCVNSANRSAPP